MLITGSLLAFVSGCGSGRPSSQGTASALVPIGAGLQGVSGLSASVFATGLAHMSAFALDGRGRLWVATSGATTHGTDGVYVVPKAGATPVKVVRGLKGPLGLVWQGATLYVSSLGQVTAFRHLRGLHFGTRATILTGPKGGGENNNLLLAPDDRLIMGVSASCDHCTPTTKWSGAIVSFRTDGSDLRVVAGGIRAAYGLALYPGTSELFASMNQRDDLGARTPGDWLGLVRQGQNWGFPACYGQQSPVCKSTPKPVAVLDPHAAAGGVAIVTGQLGSAKGPAALVAEWQLGKVQRAGLAKTGPSYAGAVTPFLAGLKNPLPVLATAGGGVLVGDWGTGKIYRISTSRRP